ncbi:helix-turn-helix domain-containing protein [Burkholderia glumae AU6208]|nr:helix-turn-helix domain-containing protein [Burkholderia glumae]QHE13084.1 helix-turn-helix domain-containing protein [Burkholderia glumae AU6208]
MNELQRVKVIESVVEGRLTGVRAAEQLGLTERQVSRLRCRFEAAGAAGLVSAKCDRPSNRQLPMNLRARAIAIILSDISTWEAANAYAPSFIADFNRRFAKPPAAGVLASLQLGRLPATLYGSKNR